MLSKIFRSADGTLRSGWAIAIFILLAVASQLPIQLLAAALGFDPSSASALDDPRLAMISVATLLGFLGATWVCCLIVKQPLSAVGFSDPRPLKLLAIGAGVGAAFITVVALVPVLAGKSSLAGPADPPLRLIVAGLIQLVSLAPQSAAEEIALRGFFFQQLTRGTNKIVAVLVTGSLFGIGHLGNPNASMIAALNIALVGIWFGLLLVRSGSLWLPIGLHIAWNWFEGFFWGQPVSGMSPGTTLFRRITYDEGFWTGGPFGPEAAALTTIALLVLIGATLVLPSRRQPAGVEATSLPSGTAQ